MQQHPSNVDMQHRGCGALTSLALNVDNRTAIAAAGGTEAVVDGIRQYPKYRPSKGTGQSSGTTNEFVITSFAAAA